MRKTLGRWLASTVFLWLTLILFVWITNPTFAAAPTTFQNGVIISNGITVWTGTNMAKGYSMMSNLSTFYLIVSNSIAAPTIDVTTLNVSGAVTGDSMGVGDLTVSNSITVPQMFTDELSVSNVVWTTNLMSLTAGALDMSKKFQRTNATGDITITALANVSVTNVSAVSLMINANGADRKLTIPASWRDPNDTTDYYITNGFIAKIAVEAWADVSTNFAMILLK